MRRRDGDGGVDELESFFSSEPLPPVRPRWVTATATVVTLALVAGVGLVAVKAASSMRAKDYSASSGSSRPVSFIVERGASAKEIAQSLAKAGVVASADAFANARALSAAPVIQPGIYQLSTRSSASQALADLTDPSKRQVVRLVVPEGWTARQVADRVSELFGISQPDFMAAVASAALPDWAPKGAGAEGLLFPATYDFLGIESATEVVSTMVDRFNREVDSLDLAAAAKAQRLSVYELVTLASLVQAEVSPVDYSKAARTLSNRLVENMPLQLDTTVAYGLGVKDVSLSAVQLSSDTPYNTYLHKGLPPSPIDNPGEQALEAAARPEPGDWKYFVTVNLDTGKTRFASDYPTFLKYKRQLTRYLKSTGSATP